MSDRIILREPRNSPWPNQCVVCGNAENHLVDWGANSNKGAVLICASCFLSAYDLFPQYIIPIEKFEAVQAELADANVKLTNLDASVASFTNSFAQLTLDLHDHLGNLGAQEPEVPDADFGIDGLEFSQNPIRAAKKNS